MSETKITTNLTAILNLHRSYSTSVSLLTNAYNDHFGVYDSIHAFGVEKSISCKSGSALKTLHKKMNQTNDWWFGVLGYDLKNEIEDLKSENIDSLNFPELFFFVPKLLIAERENQFYVLKGKIEEECLEEPTFTAMEGDKTKIHLQPRLSKKEYFETFKEVQRHISIGDFYEMNFCQEFFQEDIRIDMYAIFQEVREKISSPFMAYLQHNEMKMVCLSPERYLQKRGNKLISQPIKGTARRGVTAMADSRIQQELLNSLKEKTENTMIVDLVRNDLGKCALPGKVKVSEYLKLYTFPNIHQLISTIEAELLPDLSFIDIVNNTFPMGSMTGAPKYKVMQITEELEVTKRGWYSGALGYITPNGDFDFNVIIRSLLYNEEKKYMSYHVGGGITSFSNAEDEYEECFTKLNSVLEALN